MLFAGHAGVLLTDGNGALYFVEKVACQDPYRLLRFADRIELSDYLMGKYDVSWGQDTAHPFIMENGELMEGWRPNPNGVNAAHNQGDETARKQFAEAAEYRIGRVVSRCAEFCKFSSAFFVLQYAVFCRGKPVIE